MKKILIIAMMAAGCIYLSGCRQEKKDMDRSKASEMFERICKLTRDYTGKVEQAQDSAAWAAACIDFEEKLDKISFSYPPDTDLLLTEGQNDTIHSLMQEYVKSRDVRIHEIMRSVLEIDSLADMDSLPVEIQDSSK